MRAKPAFGFTSLSLEQEKSAVDAVTASGWTTNQSAGPHAITEALSVTTERAEAILHDFSDRRIIRQTGSANNMLETGHVQPPRTQWVRGDVPTSLELIRVLTSLEGFVTLGDSRQALTNFCGCSLDEANDFLYSLRDRNILVLTGEAPRWKWVRVEEPA